MQPSPFYCYNGPLISICLENEARLSNYELNSLWRNEPESLAAT
jgi:hypothetical protein